MRHGQQVVAGGHARAALVHHRVGGAARQQGFEFSAQLIGGLEVAVVQVQLEEPVGGARDVATDGVQGFVLAAEAVGAAGVQQPFMGWQGFDVGRGEHHLGLDAHDHVARGRLEVVVRAQFDLGGDEFPEGGERDPFHEHEVAFADGMARRVLGVGTHEERVVAGQQLTIEREMLFGDGTAITAELRSLPRRTA